MTKLEEIHELERAGKYFLQQLSALKNAITSHSAMVSVQEFHSKDIIALAESNVARQEKFMRTAADDLALELNKLQPDSAAADGGSR
jgi:hypothetical protein